ncbi:MAG: hypothetical protein RL398_814, partial [Planctomycetota bacterium]
AQVTTGVWASAVPTTNETQTASAARRANMANTILSAIVPVNPLRIVPA